MLAGCILKHPRGAVFPSCNLVPPPHYGFLVLQPVPGWQPGHQSFYPSQCLEHSSFSVGALWCLVWKASGCLCAQLLTRRSTDEEGAETRDRFISTAGRPYHIVQLEHFEGEKRGNARPTGENPIVWEALDKITSQTWPSLPPGNRSLDDGVRSPLGMEGPRRQGALVPTGGTFEPDWVGMLTPCPVEPGRATERQPTF